MAAHGAAWSDDRERRRAHAAARRARGRGRGLAFIAAAVLFLLIVLGARRQRDARRSGGSAGDRDRVARLPRRASRCSRALSRSFAAEATRTTNPPTGPARSRCRARFAEHQGSRSDDLVAARRSSGSVRGRASSSSRRGAGRVRPRHRVVGNRRRDRRDARGVARRPAPRTRRPPRRRRGVRRAWKRGLAARGFARQPAETPTEYFRARARGERRDRSSRSSTEPLARAHDARGTRAILDAADRRVDARRARSTRSSSYATSCSATSLAALAGSARWRSPCNLIATAHGDCSSRALVATIVIATVAGVVIAIDPADTRLIVQIASRSPASIAVSTAVRALRRAAPVAPPSPLDRPVAWRRGRAAPATARSRPDHAPISPRREASAADARRSPRPPRCGHRRRPACVRPRIVRSTPTRSTGICRSRFRPSSHSSSTPRSPPSTREHCRASMPTAPTRSCARWSGSVTPHHRRDPPPRRRHPRRGRARRRREARRAASSCCSACSPTATC